MNREHLCQRKMADPPNDVKVVIENNNQAQRQIPAGGHTTLALKVEKKQGTGIFQPMILALNFMRHIDNLTQTNHWCNIVMYNNFANMLRGIARKWLFSMFDKLY